MFSSRLMRNYTNSIKAVGAASQRTISVNAQRAFHFRPSTALFQAEKKPGEPEFVPEGPKHEGEFARTDGGIQFEYEEGKLSSSVPIQGRGGLHFKRTLPSFSLEGRVGLVTGGARGLGLVMSQALVISGANIAIVDLNSTFFLLHAIHLLI